MLIMRFVHCDQGRVEKVRREQRLRLAMSQLCTYVCPIDRPGDLKYLCPQPSSRRRAVFLINILYSFKGHNFLECNEPSRSLSQARNQLGKTREAGSRQ